jgi:hypothetical protein
MKDRPGPLQLFAGFERVLSDHIAHLADRGRTLRGAVSFTGHRPWVASSSAAAIPDRVLTVELPMTKNDGTLIPACAWNAMFSTIARHYGGWSCEPRLGFWPGDDGVLYLDISIKIEVWGASSKALLALVRRHIRAFGQKCIVVRECVPAAFHVVTEGGKGNAS